MLSSVVAIWVAVTLISVFSPDMVTGSEHQRLPVAAFSAWFWGLGASVWSVASLLALPRRGADSRRAGAFRAVTTIAIWAVATVVAIAGPTFVTGTDPTTIPLSALIAPFAAMAATIAVGALALVAAAVGRRHPPP